MDKLGEFYDDPLGHVMFSYPWDSEPAIQMVELAPKYQERFDSKYGPDVWACEFLDDLGAMAKANNFDGKSPVDPIQMATSSGHGIGKSVLVAFLVKWIMDTRPYCRGTITANTAEQLKAKTWAEVGKWHRLSVTSHLFQYNSGRGAMSLVNKQYPKEWFCSAQTCREENSEAFAGQHAANSTSFYIFDEASAIPHKIFEVREGGTTDGEPMVFDFGNPTRNSGDFFEECYGKKRHRWNVRCIDSRTVSISNKKRIDEWIADYGLDSDFVRVRVLGQPPSAGNIQFIPTLSVQEAQARPVTLNRFAQVAIGVDVARFGDDHSVIYCRVGDDARSWVPQRFLGLDTVQLTGRVIETVRAFRNLEMKIGLLAIDGTGVGGGVVDQLRHAGYNPTEVQFGSRPTDSAMYRYRVDEMWGRMRDAIKRRLILPTAYDPFGQQLFDDLTQREFGYTLAGNKIFLEPKADMKERGIASPDLADALALTFAVDVAPSTTPHGQADKPNMTNWDNDPLEGKD